MKDSRSKKNASNLSRRDFGRLTSAAVGGVLLGATMVSKSADSKTDHDPNLLLQDKHVCRGLNTCKGKGKGGDNSCAGTGNCAIAEKHTCSGSNECKGQGGCGEYPGQNSCKGTGSCNVPLTAPTWKKARKAFEAQMKKTGKKFGEAPKAKA